MVACVTAGIISTRGQPDVRQIKVPHNLNYDAPLVSIGFFEGTTVVPLRHLTPWDPGNHTES
jgi:hypothetical protein